MSFVQPPHDCPLCPRLAAFRKDNHRQYPAFFNGPVPSFGNLDAQLLIVGLAPGLKGANQTGRPFTGDYAGLVLYSSLRRYGLAEGEYDPGKVAAAQAEDHLPHHGADGFHLVNCRITNAVRCVPQQNKPDPGEIKTCNGFLTKEINAMPNLKVILTLGQIAHKAVMMAFGLKQSAHAFGHGAQHTLMSGKQTVRLFNSYHCSRYNINTGTLTQERFDEVIERISSYI